MKVDLSFIEKLLKLKVTIMVWVGIGIALVCFLVGLNRGCAYGKAHPNQPVAVQSK